MIFQKFSNRSEIFFCFTIHKKLNQSCSLKKKILFLKKKILSLKKTLKKKIVSGTHRGGFQFIMILTPYGVTFHRVVVIGLGKNLLFKSVLAHCAQGKKLWLLRPPASTFRILETTPKSKLSFISFAEIRYLEKICSFLMTQQIVHRTFTLV